MSALQDLRHPSAGVADTRHIYRDKTGAPVLVANRYEGNGKGKFFLPYDVAKGAWKAPQSRPVYYLDRIAQAAPEQPVFWVEGEKCADALTGLGYLASTSFGGSKALAKTDLTPLAGRTVIIWPDHDEPGRDYAAQLAEQLVTLHSATPLILPVSDALVKEHDQAGVLPSYLPKGWDVADAIAAGWGCGEIDAQVNSAFCDLPDATAAYLTKRTGTAANAPHAPTYTFKGGDREADALRIGNDTDHSPAHVDGLELWKTPQDEPYVTICRKVTLSTGLPAQQPSATIWPIPITGPKAKRPRMPL